MYFSNLAVDGVVTRCPEIFNSLKADTAAHTKRTLPDAELDDAPFPVEPIYWPEDEPNANIRHYRGAGALAIIHGGDDGMLVKLNTACPYESFVERKYLQAAVPAVSQAGTVLYELNARSLWPNVADDVFAPKLGSGTDADLSLHVREGRHVEGVAARLVALALEHALVPFTQRTRVRNAAASYWCTGKYRSDNIVYSLQHTQAILQWANPGQLGVDNDPTVVVWVGDAHKVRGMSLLSRIMDQGGPMMLQESYLCKQFDAGRLLMVGTGALVRDFRAIQPADLHDAINEALWILVTYNNLRPEVVRNMLRLLARNLPLVDIAHYHEQDGIFWQVREGKVGPPDLDAQMEQKVDMLIESAFGSKALDDAGLDNEARRRGVLSDLFRRELMSPPDGVQGLAPHTDHEVDWVVAALLGCMQVSTNDSLSGVSVYVAELDIAVPPAVPNVPARNRAAFNNIMDAFSGRSGFHIFGYSQAAVLGVMPNPPGGWATVASVPTDLALPRNIPNDGSWLEWVGGNDAAGVPYEIRSGLRAYVIRKWVPTGPNTYPSSYVAPPGTLRRFDVPDDFRMAMNMNNTWPDVAGAAVRVGRYINENDGGGTPLAFMDVDGQRSIANLTIAQRSLLLIRGIAYIWDAANLGSTQNDAFGRWVRVTHPDRKLTTPPDELLLVLGGLRSRRYVEANGGLWTLCYQPVAQSIMVRAGFEHEIELLKDRQRLASYLLKLRCAVEMSDQLNRISNARIVGCIDGFIWPQSVDDRLARAYADEPTMIDPATYLARQALTTATVFDHPDSAVLRTFDVKATGTLRLREPRLSAAYSEGALKHLNWVTPQVLRYRTWTNYYGVQSPSFVPDRVGRSWLKNARYGSSWVGVDDAFLPGAMIAREDEIWSAVLTAFAGDAWYPAALELAAFGSDLRIPVGDVRNGFSSRFTPIQMRLNLPYETRFGVLTVWGNNLDADVRPVLSCDPAATLADGDSLYNTAMAYSTDGLNTQYTLDPAASNVVENLDVRHTTFASHGLDFTCRMHTAIFGDYVSVEKSGGQFWMSTLPTVGRVVAGMSAGLQRLLMELAPPDVISDPHDDGKGTGVDGPARIALPAPNVAQLAPPNEDNRGNLPLAEINVSSAATILSSLNSLSPEVQALLANALAGNTKKSLGTNTTAASSDPAGGDSGDA